jgi:hypothetical protein
VISTRIETSTRRQVPSILRNGRAAYAAPSPTQTADPARGQDGLPWTNDDLNAAAIHVTTARVQARPEARKERPETDAGHRRVLLLAVTDLDLLLKPGSGLATPAR